MLEMLQVGKTYRGGKRAVEEVTLRLPPGLLGLLGPNGAGKSTLMRIAATVTRPSTGRVLLDGTDVVARPLVLRERLGYLPQDFGVYPNLTAPEFLRYLAAVKGLGVRSARARIEELLQLVNLTDARRRPLGQYSGGMRQRVGIAQALLGDPYLLIVDEPTVGLDPEERLRLRNLLGELAADRIIILSTHIVSDVAAVAADIAVLAGGRIRQRGTPEQLIRGADGLVWEAQVPATALAELRQQHLITRTVRTGDGIRVRILADQPPLPTAVAVPPDLEDAYLHTVHGSTMAPQWQAGR